MTSIRIDWTEYFPRIVELSDAGLGTNAILAEIGLEPTASNQTQVQKFKRAVGCAQMQPGPKRGKNPNCQSPSAVWIGYRITSDWRDPACVARDMAGRRFEDMPGMGASSSNPVFVPARKVAPSAGVADYSGAR